VTHDTTKDPRLLVAQRACALLKKSVQQKSRVRASVPKEKLVELASAAESAIMALTYMYVEPRELTAAEPMGDLATVTASLAEALSPLLASSESPQLLGASLRWCLRTLSGLPGRLANPGRTLASGVDLVAVRVRNVVRIEPLRRTRVDDGSAEYTAVTNMSGVEPGQVLAAAFLPPREVGGAVSEVMFLGGGKRPEAPGTLLTEEQVDAREAASILHEELLRR
jgi:predicted RNA-binding protein with EMAP domain